MTDHSGEPAVDLLRRIPLVFPDPVTGSGELSAAAYLWFDHGVAITLPPVVVTPESFQFVNLVAQRRPEWAHRFNNLFSTWREFGDAARDYRKLIEPLQGQAWRSVFLSYDGTAEAIQRSADLLAAAGMSVDDAAQVADRRLASGEVMRHILLEKYWELDGRLDDLYEYVGQMMNSETLIDTGVCSYFLRLTAFQSVPDGNFESLLLTNHRLFEVLASLPVETEAPDDARLFPRDSVAWVFFRLILSPYFDPLSEQRVSLLAGLRRDRREEIERLRVKCLLMAEEIKDIGEPDDLMRSVETYIRTHVAREIAALLGLTMKALQQFLVDLFSDQKTWYGLIGSAVAAAAGQDLLTAGGAVVVLSSLGSRAVKHAADHHEKLKTSDFALVYSAANRLY